MATLSPMARVPFAPLDSSRLQHLASAKNRQNGLLMTKSAMDIKTTASTSKVNFQPTKRPFEPATFDDFDSENVDPSSLCSPSKKTKGDASDKPFQPFAFSVAPSKSMPPPPTIPSRLTTPARANTSSPRAPLTAPAGRSPRSKASVTMKNRRISAPFSRIDPPFSTRSDTSLPFSLDAALSGTFAKATPKKASATIQESMPKNWFFDIYEDSPEEEAANLMEHSTLTLDLSSDDDSSKNAKDDRGKENTPPDDYDAPTASRPAAERVSSAPTRVKKADIIRKKVVTDDMDDGQRSPLSDLETEYFIPEGLTKDSHVVVNATPEKTSSASSDKISLFATPVPFAAGPTRKPGLFTPSKARFDMPVVNAEGDVKGDIIVWEDSPASTRSLSPLSAEGMAKDNVADENTPPGLTKV